MISDGLGPSGLTMAREYLRMMGKRVELMDSLDDMLVGSTITRSKDALVTDSAAAATAFSCGVSVPNGFVAMYEGGTPCKTILEEAKELGYLTGVVTTSAIVDATPASFTSHVKSRKLRDEISLQQLGAGEATTRAADVLLESGRDGSSRKDELDIEEVIKEKGWTVKLGRSFVDSVLPAKLLSATQHDTRLSIPLINLVVDDYYMSYEIDRNPETEPSLAEMTNATIKFLQSNLNSNHKGFFLVVEGGRIDTAAHENDHASYLRDTLAYLDALYHAKEFITNNGSDSAIIAVSDHDTGGLTLNAEYKDEDARAGYDWSLAPVGEITKSFEQISYDILSSIQNGTFNESYIKNKVLAEYLGVSDPTSFEIEAIANIKGTYRKYEICGVISKIISNRTRIRFSTTAHTSVDTHFYAEGANKEKLVGAHKAIHIRRILSSLLQQTRRLH